MLETIRQWLLTLSLVVLAGVALAALCGASPSVAAAEGEAGTRPECHVVKPLTDVPEALEEPMRDHVAAGRRAGMFLTGTGTLTDPRILCAW